MSWSMPTAFPVASPSLTRPRVAASSRWRSPTWGSGFARASTGTLRTTSALTSRRFAYGAGRWHDWPTRGRSGGHWTARNAKASGRKRRIVDPPIWHRSDRDRCRLQRAPRIAGAAGNPCGSQVPNRSSVEHAAPLGCPWRCGLVALVRCYSGLAKRDPEVTPVARRWISTALSSVIPAIRSMTRRLRASLSSARSNRSMNARGNSRLSSSIAST
jgi:hypothetical protein